MAFHNNNTNFVVFFVFYCTHTDFSSPPAMLRSIGYPSDNHSGRKWVDSGHNRRRTCDHSVSTSAFEHSFISCLWTCEEAHCCLPILQQPLPSMHNLILHWFVTLASVESSEVRVCSYSLSDVIPMAILLSVPEPTHVI